MTTPSLLDRQLEELENKLERQHGHQQNNNNANSPPNTESQEIDRLMKAFTQNANVPTNDDVVCINPECQDPKYAWLKGFVGLVVKIRQVGERDPPEMEDPGVYPDFKYEDQKEPFCVVEFNLFHAFANNNININDIDYQNEISLTKQQQQQQQQQRQKNSISSTSSKTTPKLFSASTMIGALSSPPGMDLNINNQSNSGEANEYGSNNGSETASGYASPRDPNNNNDTNSSNSSSLFTKVSIPSGVLHAAVPASILQIRDRGISALDTVVHIPTSRIGSVGGYRLLADVMPVDFPQNSATSQFVNDEKQREVFQRAGLLIANADGSVIAGDNEDETRHNNKKFGLKSPYLHQHSLELVSSPSSSNPVVVASSSPTSNSKNNNNQQKQVPSNKTFKLHCTDLMPGNPYRRTVAVVNKQTLQVGFIDDCEMNAVVMLDNGSLCLIPDVEALEKDLTRPPKHIAKEIRAKNIQNLNNNNKNDNNNAEDEQHGSYGDEDENNIDAEEARIRKMLKEFGVNFDQQQANNKNNKNKKGPFQGKKSSSKNNKKNKKNSENSQKYDDDADNNNVDDEEEEEEQQQHADDEEEDDDEIDAYFGENYTDAQISAARGHSDSNDGATMDDIGKEEFPGKKKINKHNKKNTLVSNNDNGSKPKNHQKTTSSSSLTIDDDANPSSRQGSFALSEHLPPPSVPPSHEKKNQTATINNASIKDFNSENFAPFDDGENDEEEEEEEEDEEEQEHISVKWDMIDEQLLDDGIWPPPNVNFPSFVQNNYNNNNINTNNNNSSISSAISTPTSIVEHQKDSRWMPPVTNTLFPASATSALPNASSNNMDCFDETIGKVHGLPLWARTRPTLGWLRKCIVPHFMVKNKEIIMAVGQPEYQKNKERGYDVGTIICLSCERVYVKWTTPNFDPNNTEVPVSSIEECAPENLFIIQNFYHELLGVDFMHDVAFLRTPPKVTSSENSEEQQTNNVDDNNNNNYDYSHGTIQDREIARERAKVEFEENYLKFMLHDPDQIVLNPQDEEKRKSLLPYYNFEEVETSVTGLNAVELNKFYARFQFPESLEAAAKRMSGRNAIPNLLFDAKWAQFFKDLCEILCSAVRVVDIESQCCVTWANGERSHGVPARELVRPEAQPGSVFEHITALPRDLVHRPQDVVDFQATLALHQQQQPQKPKQAAEATDSETELKEEADNIKTQESEKGHQPQQQQQAEHFCFVHRKEPVKFETCAMFDVARCGYPDTDCVVSDVVTLRTKDEQAQVAALAGPPPREVGQVMSINPIEMTAEVAWRKFCDWEYLLDKTNAHTNNNNETHVHQPSPSFTIPLDSYPTISTAEARVEAAANQSSKREDTFAKYFLESINARKDNDANSSSPPSSPSPFSYNPSFMVGQVMGKLAFDQVIVKWWDGSFEVLPIGRLVVHHFPYDDEEAVEGEDDDFIDDEDGGDDDGEEENNNNNLHVTGDNLVDIPSPMMPAGGQMSSSTTATTTNSQQQQQHVDPFEQDEMNKNKNTNNSSTRGGALGSFISTAAKSVGNLLFSAVMGKNAASDAVSFISSAMTSNKSNTNNIAGAIAGVDEDKSHSSNNLENTSSTKNDADAEKELNQDPSSSSPSSLHPVSTTPGTFQACSRFVSHLIDSDTSLSFTPAQPTIFTRRLLNEIKSLRTTLMPDIFVKSNEDRSHTFKFAIAGAIHTPYYGGFYSFDMALPSNFPNSPPTLKFHARNMRLNPNLYEDGHVCLSLLGTWNGQDQCEQWSPSSTLRQVFLSVQAIILCQEPYYNEAGYDSIRGTPEGQAHSRLYNEHTFLLKISHLMHFAAQPPPDWVFEFREHYKKQVPRLLQRMRKYAENNNNNNNGEAGSVNADGLVSPLSAGLRHALPNRIDALQKQYDVLVTKWNKELEEYEAGFVGGHDDEDDDDDDKNRRDAKKTEDP